MDELVLAAMRKWPHVPDCYGWLGLDARGRWWMRDAQAQAAGPFVPVGQEATNPVAKGSLLLHDKLVEFIGRNYLCDAQGQWYFQNGPQRVFVELEACPWVLRVATDGRLSTHTGKPVEGRDAWVDDLGRLYVHTDVGLGLVHTLDMEYAAHQIELQNWCLGELSACELPDRFGFVPSPEKQKPPR
jgi:Protein of unknown function (DUF2946)